MIAGNNAITIRENNIALIIRLINKAKICSRADLAIQTGLKQATITYIINNLINWGLVEETGSIEGRLKRRSIGITLNNKTYRIIGIRLNRHYIVVGLFSITGEMILQREMKLDKHIEPEEVMSHIKTFVHELINSSDGTKILGIGMAIPGPFIPGEGKIALMSGSPGWESVSIEDELREEFTLPVFLEHDANCGALAEFWYGDVGEAKDILFVAADVGIGAGILVDGQLYKGKLGTAGEIGHMSIDYNGPKCECGNRGCLELYCSTKKLMQEYKQETFINSTIEEILHAVVDGDPAARKVYSKTAAFLGLGLVNLINILNPELIILSDTLSLGGDYLTKVISDTLQKHLLDAMYKSVKIKLGTRFAGESMLFGASAVILENLLLQPSTYFKPVGYNI